MDSVYPVEIRRRDYNNDFAITASLCFKCNYRCPYCYNETHVDHVLLDLDQTFYYVSELVKARKMTLDFYAIGGEPTLHPKFQDFAKKFNDSHFGGLNVYTNLSQPIDYYVSIMQQNVTVIATYHTYPNKDAEFIEKVLKLKDLGYDKLMLVNVIFESRDPQKCIDVYDQLYGKITQLELKSEHCSDFTEEDLQKYYDRHSRWKNMPDAFEVKYSDGSIKYLNYDDCCKIDVKHWLCDCGRDGSYIDNRGNVYPCESYFFDKAEPLFNISSFSQEDLTRQKTVCGRQKCYNYHIHKKRVFNADKR